MPVKVILVYQEKTSNWQPFVENAKDATESLQAFAAAVLTCQMLDPQLLDKSLVQRVDGTTHMITPAVFGV